MRQSVYLNFLSVALFGKRSEGRGERVRRVKAAAIPPEVWLWSTIKALFSPV